MSVDDWARREADFARGPDIWTPAYDPTPERQAYFEGIVHAFSALLSDEATMGAVDLLREAGHDIGGVAWRAALQAAIDAVTKEARND